MQYFRGLAERYSFAMVPLVLILLGCGLWPEMELLVPSLPDMKRAFVIQDSHIQLLLTLNFFGFFVGVLLAGPLCDSIGRRRVLILGAAAYLLVSFFSALATNFYFLIVARFLQGLTMTGPVIAGGVLLMELTSGPRQIFWMALGNSMVTFCMAAAPILGATINTSFGFKGNLWSIFILGLVGIMPAVFFAPESLATEKRKTLNLKGLLHAYGRLLKDNRFMFLALPICALAAAYWIYVGVSALYLVDHLGIPASMFGRYQGPIVGCFSVLSLVSSKILRRFGLITSLLGGIVCMATGVLMLFSMSFFFADEAFLTTVFMMLFVGGMAPVCGLLFPHAMQHLPAELQGSAQSLIHGMRLFLAALGTFVLGFVYSGPLLPVATMLLFLFMSSVMLLFLGRSFIEDKAAVTQTTMLH